jgi:hypothetical protein
MWQAHCSLFRRKLVETGFLSTVFLVEEDENSAVLLRTVGHSLCHITCIFNAVAQLIEALRYKSEGSGSISDGVTGIFHSLRRPCGRTMALESTQPLT